MWQCGKYWHSFSHAVVRAISHSLFQAGHIFAYVAVSVVASNHMEFGRWENNFWSFSLSQPERWELKERRLYTCSCSRRQSEWKIKWRWGIFSLLCVLALFRRRLSFAIRSWKRRSFHEYKLNNIPLCWPLASTLEDSNKNSSKIITEYNSSHAFVRTREIESIALTEHMTKTDTTIHKTVSFAVQGFGVWCQWIERTKAELLFPLAATSLPPSPFRRVFYGFRIGNKLVWNEKINNKKRW